MVTLSGVALFCAKLGSRLDKPLLLTHTYFVDFASIVRLHQVLRWVSKHAHANGAAVFVSLPSSVTPHLKFLELN